MTEISDSEDRTEQWLKDRGWQVVTLDCWCGASYTTTVRLADPDAKMGISHHTEGGLHHRMGLVPMVGHEVPPLAIRIDDTKTPRRP